MELNDLLSINEDEFVLVEESYVLQKRIERTLDYLAKIKKEGEDVAELVKIFDVNNKDEIIGIAIFDKGLGFWLIFTDIIADRQREEEFEALASVVKGDKGRKIEVKREKFHEGVIEFYSLGLVNRLFCDCNLEEESFYPRRRIEGLKKVLSEFLMGNTRVNALEIACGNGGATIALHESGIFPLTLDMNKCEICKGLEEGMLDPKKSIVLDCSILSTFFGEEFDIVFGFMLGKITSFNRFEWEGVIREVPKVLKREGRVLFTVSSKEEVEIVKEILDGEFEEEIKENKESDGYLDQWIYIGEPKKH